jgi:hypothetical protein
MHTNANINKITTEVNIKIEKSSQKMKIFRSPKRYYPGLGKKKFPTVFTGLEKEQ